MSVVRGFAAVIPVVMFVAGCCPCGSGEDDCVTDDAFDVSSDSPAEDIVDPGEGICMFSTTCGMALVPAGPFWMGCDGENRDDCELNQLPYRQVTLSAFHIDRTEVTVGDYRACVNAGVCTAPASLDPNCAWLLPDHEKHPMTCIDWFQSQDYCGWQGKRLPTEAEWEKAARGADGRTYPWGEADLSCDLAVTFDEELGGRGCGADDTMPVCSKSPAGDSPYGLCDMAGNVWERTADWYCEMYYAEGQLIDPAGPASGPGKVSRGGSITLQGNTTYLRTFNRNYHLTTATDQLLGFRCAMSFD